LLRVPPSMVMASWSKAANVLARHRRACTDGLMSRHCESIDDIRLPSRSVKGTLFKFRHGVLEAERRWRYSICSIVEVLRRIGQVDCYVESLEEIVAKKIRYQSAEARTRDIVDIGIALTHSPHILRELVIQNADTLDELLEWREALGDIDGERYLEELELLELAAKYRDLSIKSNEAIIAGVDSVKS